MLPDDPLHLLKSCRVRVLLVPIHPIRQDTFQSYVDVISQFSVVSMTDLTPPDLSRSTSKYTEQMYHHEGYMHINYATSYNKEHLPLEEFQLHRQVMAVIGIMHCQEVDSIGEGYKRFQNILTRYPNVLVSRCFAFEPTEQQADDTRGCIMIPDDSKKLSFYLMTQINDLANELVTAFGNQAAQYEKRPMISGPLLHSPLTPAPLTNQLSMSPALGTPTPYSPSLQMVQSSASLAQMGAPSPSPSPLPGTMREASMATLATQDSTVSILGNLFAPDKTKKRTPSRAQKLVGDLFLLAGRLDLAISSYSAAIEAMKATADYQWLGAAMEAYYCALILSLLPKTGVWPSDTNGSDTPMNDDAGPLRLRTLQTPTYDDVFTAATSHPQFRMLICDIPERYREITSYYERAFQTGQPGFYPLLQIKACVDLAKFLSAMWHCRFNGPVTNGAGVMLTHTESKGIADIASNIGLTSTSARSGTAAGQTTSAGAATDKDRIILHGGLGTSRVDVSTWIMKGWASGIEYLTMADQINCVAGMAAAYGQVGYRKKHAFFLRQTGLLLLANLRATRKAREAEMSMQHQTTEDRGRMILDAAEANGVLDCIKKVCEAFGVPASNPSQSSGDAALNENTATSSLEGFNLDDEEEDQWLDMYFDETDLDAEELGSKDQLYQAMINRKRIPLSRLRYGWPELQVDVIKECMDVAEIVDAIATFITYGIRLLQRSHKILSEQEQSEIAEALMSVASRGRTILGKSQPSNKGPPDIGSVNDLRAKLPQAVSSASLVSGVCRVPTLRRLRIVRQVATVVPLPHPRSSLSGTATAEVKAADPFLYNPFASRAAASAKGKGKEMGQDVILVVNEPAYFDLTLANPFAFDLELQSLTIFTSGIPFKPVPVTIVIPAESRAFSVRLSGTPQEAGTLNVRGCKVRMFGGVVEEEVLPLLRLQQDPRKRTKEGTRRRQDERDRFGKRNLDFGGADLTTNGPPSAGILLADELNKAAANWSVPIKVIPPQPLVQVVRKGASAPGPMMLFEGERTNFVLQIENIGTTPVDFFTLGFAETYESDVTGSPPAAVELMSPISPAREQAAAAVEDLEDVYERDVHTRSLRVFWVEHFGGNSTDESNAVEKTKIGPKIGDAVVERIPLNLAPGQNTMITVGTFGKRGSTGGTIKIDYGYVFENEHEITNSTTVVEEVVEQTSSNELPVLEPQGSDGQLSSPEKTTTMTKSEKPQIKENTDQFFYTRQISIPILITVQAGLQPVNMDILLLDDSSVNSLPDMSFSGEPEGAFGKDTQRNLSVEEMTLDVDHALRSQSANTMADGELVDGFGDRSHEFCLFTFDLRNVWRSPFEIRFEVFDDDDSLRPTYTTKTVIHAGMTKRILLPIKRLNLPSSVTKHPIPQPEWKQFVVGKTKKLTPAQERERRTLFWYREALVGGVDFGPKKDSPNPNTAPHTLSSIPTIFRPGRIVATWFYSRARMGSLSLRNLKLRRTLLGILKKEEVRIDVRVLPFDKSSTETNGGPGASSSKTIVKKGKDKFVVGLWESLIIEWSVCNSKDRPFQPLLRILPTPDPPPQIASVALSTPSVVTSSLQSLHHFPNALPKHTLDSSDSFHSLVNNILVGGALQTPLTVLEPSGGRTTYRLPIVTTGTGKVRLLWHIEDITRGSDLGPSVVQTRKAIDQSADKSQKPKVKQPPVPPLHQAMIEAWEEEIYSGGDGILLEIQ
ncbi:transport protein Trs120 or TRAPPC9 TRAPP II complex subunit-domain-containing protein [Phlyctochytrium arcticum]|nr:transport protein Trs120 or TRAPPC9 TRAPP II complex subunit-domain-containing protein [Phlyctochytrium arcticum]